MITITTPPALLVTVDEVKVALGESGTDRDDLIEALLWAAQSELDGPNGWVGISVAQQSAEIKASSFDCPPVRLPGGPILSATVQYLDADGAEQTLDASAYVVGANGTLLLGSGATWPTLYGQGDAITVAYDVGITEEGDPRIQQMRTAIILHVRMTLDGIDPDASRRAIESLVRPMWVPVM